jgi:hypothetical protein
MSKEEDKMLKFSFLQCKVNHLRKAVESFQNAGFTVEWGRSGQRGNAFIWFEEGPYIEVFETVPGFPSVATILGLFFGQSAKDKWKYWDKHPGGWSDLGLVAINKPQEHTLAGFKAARLDVMNMGIATSRIIKGSRTRPDGEKTKFAFFTTSPVELPIIATDYSPPQRPATVTHANGARGIEQITVGVCDKDFEKYRALTGDDKKIKWIRSRKTQILEVSLTGTGVITLQKDMVMFPQKSQKSKYLEVLG